MRRLPLNSTVLHSVATDGVRNAHGTIERVFSDPAPVLVYGWHTGQSEEPQIAGHDRVRVDGQVFAPESWQPSAFDRVTLPGKGEFEVIGPVEDYNNGPFGFRPGVVVNLKRVTG